MCWDCFIASHHGEYAFGSPTLPRTPEAQLLHYIDNIDAKMEMFRRGYAADKKLGPRIYERVRPLPSNLVEPLASYEPSELGDRSENFSENDDTG